jgi:spore maturation protein CgeB
MTISIVVFGLSITSSWGNGHATTYRALIKALCRRGHRVTFLERDVPWYRTHRDLPNPPYCRTELYSSLNEVPARFTKLVTEADLVIIGSYVPDGIALSDWITMNATGVTAFYDIDTPVTLAKLSEGTGDYIAASLIPRFDIYLSFAGGPALEMIEKQYGSPRARPLYCSVDPDFHAPVACEKRWALGYLGTYSEDRQAALERLLIEPARRCPDCRFAVAGPQYPANIDWPENVELISHLPPRAHPEFYCSQEFTLNVTRAAMVQAGYSPSVRLFEAAACGVPIISDSWPGLDSFFTVGKEILVCDEPAHVIDTMRGISEQTRLEIAQAARQRVLQNHTADTRAAALEDYYREALRSNVVEVSKARQARPKIGAVA